MADVMGVVIVDDDKWARDKAESLLTNAAETEVRAALCGANAPGAIARAEADLVLIGKIGMDPELEAVFTAALARPKPPALAGYGGFDTERSSATHLNGVLPPSLAGQDFVHAVRLLAGGLRVWATRSGHTARLARLTPREQDVLTLLSDGLSNDQVAHRLGLHVGTVKDHIRAVYAKCGVTNRVEAALFAHGIDTTSPPSRKTRGLNGHWRQQVHKRSA
ncbi:response regulator transcription factor [Streptomyces sp. NPDC006879]|uniref:helix-turn-helix transcriptional regulator n=1 Tax=Streptomyces sp. NPDC006879 TaxID=3364767 RepID=UPI003687A6AD